MYKEFESNDPVNSLPANSSFSGASVGETVTAAVMPVINKQVITDQLSDFKQTLQHTHPDATTSPAVSSQKILLHLVKQKQKDIAESKKQHLPQEVKLICHEFERILVRTSDIQEKVALFAALQIDSFGTLLQLAFDAHFSRYLEEQFQVYLNPAQAKLLSARLASRLKRMLQKMQSWENAFWSEFESTMQILAVWEKQANPLPWLTNSSVQASALKAENLADSPLPTLDDLLMPDSPIQDKIRQLKQLSQTDAFRWEGSHSSKNSLEVRRLLAALSRMESMQQLIAFVFAAETWAAVPEGLQTRLYQIFALYADTDLDTIHVQFMAGVSEAQKQAAEAMMLQIELAIHKVLKQFKQEPRLSFLQALDTLRDQQTAIQSRTELVAEHSALSYFQKYRQA